MRLFLALQLPPELQKRLLKLQEELESADWSVRFTPPEKLHLSLHFLGETPDNLLEDLRHDLGALMHARRAFDLSVGGLGAFPTLEDPRVLWAGVHGRGAALEDLFEASYKILKGYRIFELKREFTPHITLGRVSQLKASWDPRRLEGLMGQWEKLGRLPVDELALFKSQTHPDGAIYEKIQSYKLTGV